MVNTNGATDLADLVITFHGANDAPVGVDDGNTAYEMGATTSGASATGNVLGNDTDVDNGHSLNVSLSTTTVTVTGLFGDLHLTTGGHYTYDVDDLNVTVDALSATQPTTATFTYTVVDEHGATSTAQLTVHIQGSNDAPVGVDNVFTAIEAGTQAGSAATGNLLGNDTDVDNNHVLNIAQSGSSATAIGTMHITSSGNFA